MRKHNPLTGQTRIRSWFAILPVTAGNETRWLEKVTLEQSYNTQQPGWCNDRFVNPRPILHF